MKKILFTAIFISTSALANKPFPQVCEAMLEVVDEASTLMVKADPTKAKEMAEIQQVFAGMKKDWVNIQQITSRPQREEMEKLFTNLCETYLQEFTESLHKVKQKSNQ